MDAVLKPFIEDVKKLVCFYQHEIVYIHVFMHFVFMKEKGHMFNVRGCPHNLVSMVLSLLCQLIASSCLGGFKESCSAKRPCRQCLGDNDEIRQKVY